MTDRAGNRIKIFRGMTGMNRPDFATLTGTTPSALTYFENGRQRVTEEYFEKLCLEWPEFCLWFVTGKTREDLGQTKPDVDKISTLIKESMRKKDDQKIS